MASVQPWSPMTEKIWTEEEKEAWLAEHGEGVDARGHLRADVPDRAVHPALGAPGPPDARSAVVWGQRMSQVFADGQDGASAIVAAHHEGNSLEIYSAVTPRPRLHRVL